MIEFVLCIAVVAAYRKFCTVPMTEQEQGEYLLDSARKNLLADWAEGNVDLKFEEVIARAQALTIANVR